MDLLERENRRLRRQVEDLVGPDNPCFDRTAFQRALRFYTFVFMLPVQLLLVPLLILVCVPGLLPPLPMIGSVPLFDTAGIGTRHPGMGLGIVAVGGLSIGVVALGGFAVGLVALGGGAIGVIAVGGGSFGLIALGGGAVGYIAIGGGAIGRYALGQSAYGKAVFSMRRQDPEAVKFFVRWLPRLKAAVTTPLPVVPLDQTEGAHAR
jgi:hypothetical protein